MKSRRNKRKFMSFKEFLNESNNKESVIEEFEKVFPKEIVEADPKEKPFEMTEENMQKIFDVLNKIMFDGKLNKIPIKIFDLIGTAMFLQEKTKKHIRIGDLKSFMAMYFNLHERDHTRKTCIIQPKSESIVIRYFDDKMCSFGLALSVICHEMIHYYDSRYGTLLNLEYQRAVNKIGYDEHNTPYFKKLMTTAKRKNILVKKDAEDKSYDELNKEAQDYLKNLPTEKIKSESENEDQKIDKTRTKMSIKINDDLYALILF